MFQPLLRPLRLRHKTSGWASGGPARDKRFAGEEQQGRGLAGEEQIGMMYRGAE